MSKYTWLIIAVLLALWCSTEPVQAATMHDPGVNLFSTDASGDFICTTQLLRRNSRNCPAFGPGTRALRLAYVRAMLPDPLPELPVEQLELPEGAITNYTYANVSRLPASTYAHPMEAEAGLPPRRTFVTGSVWVSLQGMVEYNEQVWYQINPNEFIQAEHLSPAYPSRFRGVLLTEQPPYPFGWVTRNVNPSALPGSAPRTDVVLRRYQMVTFFAQEHTGNSQLWYMIAPDQWIEQSYVSRVDVDPPPEGVAPGEKWIEIDAFEQTLAAYEGERMVFATLIASGRQATATPNGLNRIWAKLRSTPMRNPNVGPTNPIWYYLEDVEYTQYFFGSYALHTSYWHDSFGFVRSYGCVNMTPLDARWLFDWTTPYLPETSRGNYNTADTGTWVWVHRSNPFTTP